MTAGASRLAEQRRRGEPSPQCLANGCRDLVGRHARRRDVGDRAGRRREPNAVAADDVSIGEWVRRGVDRDPGLGDQSATLARHREVDSVGDDVGQVVELQRRLVRHDRAGPLAQPAGDDLLARRGRVVAQPVQPAGDAQEAPGLGVMGQQRRAEAVPSAWAVVKYPA